MSETGKREDHRATALAYVKFGARIVAVAASYGALASLASSGNVITGALVAVVFLTLGAAITPLGYFAYRDLTEPFMIEGPWSYLFAWAMGGLLAVGGVICIGSGLILPWTA